MSYSKWGATDIQCIYPKASKSIIDAIDRLLPTHYGSTKEELDFIIQLRHQVPHGREHRGRRVMIQGSSRGYQGRDEETRKGLRCQAQGESRIPYLFLVR